MRLLILFYCNNSSFVIDCSLKSIFKADFADQQQTKMVFSMCGDDRFAYEDFEH